jgi:mRNA interferase MazF
LKIKQGDVYWVTIRPPRGSEPGFRHPIVIVQNDVYNASAIGTVVGCLLTSNLIRARALGNVLLKKFEANLPRACVVNVSQITTLDRSQIREKIGTLSKERVAQIIAGLKLLLEPRSL